MLQDLKSYTVWLCRWVFVVYVFATLVANSPIGRDNSDPGQWGGRSGITPRTDALTGCQYLEAANGGITPRLGRDGRQLGCRT